MVQDSKKQPILQDKYKVAQQSFHSTPANLIERSGDYDIIFVYHSAAALTFYLIL